jgi:hypothetical protein
MILSYGARLICLLTVVAGLVYAAVQFALFCGAPFLMRRLDAASSRRRERLLYLLQIAPALLAIFVAGAVCCPEYLRHEPTRNNEPVGWITLLLAAAVCIWFGSALLRGVCINLRTLRFARACRRSGRVIDRSSCAPLRALAETTPPLVLVGFLRPFIIISEALLEPGGLNSGSLQVALDHERAHALQFDNWKLLTLYFLPRLHGDAWRRQWQAAADWAADDDAVGGDAARSLLLAEALVCTARLVKPARSTVICAALTSAEAGLAARVDRLLRPRWVSPSAPNSLLLGLASLVFLAIGAAAGVSPWIYSACEQILHLGGF